MECPACAAMLSRREQEVHDLAVKGLSNKEIAERLFIEEKSVKHHMTAILKKKGVNNRFKLMYKAFKEHGLKFDNALPRGKRSRA